MCTKSITYQFWYSISDIRSEPKVIHNNEYIRIRADEKKNTALTGGYISKIQWFFILFHFKSFNVFDNDVNDPMG